MVEEEEGGYGVYKKIHGSECGAQVVDVLEVEGLTFVFRYWTFRLHFGIVRNSKKSKSG